MKCGRFELEAAFARGGMGEVWSGRHGERKVVLKFLHRPEPRFRALFDNEVRVHASLGHPLILSLLDTGVLTSTISPTLVAGTPWLAVEYAEQGELMKAVRTSTWPTTFAILVAVLRALAHAHAANVLHHDIKPANLLLSSPRDPHPGLRLADFGIAHVLEASPTERRSMGTPRSLAPEQCEEGDHALGPWTDLYALGCFGFRLTHGRWPFEGKGHAVRYAHLFKPLPELPLLPDVPPAMGEWIRWLLKKRPSDRPRTAPEALDALMTLDPGVPPEEPALRSSHQRYLHRRSMSAWRAFEPPRPPPVLPNTNDALFGLRMRDSVGHERLRERLWEELGKVRKRGTCRVVSLVGDPGCGVSHLGSWFMRRVGELGAAFGVAFEGGEGALAKACASILRVSTQEVDRDAVLHALEALGPLGSEAGYFVDLTTSVIEGRADRATSGGVLLELLRRRYRGPILVWIDDAMATPELRDFAVANDGDARASVLFLLGRDERVERRLKVGPLRDQDLTTLVRGVTPLSGGVHERILAASQGSPRRAMRMLHRMQSRPRDASVESWLVRQEGIESGTVLPELSEMELRVARLAALVGLTPDPKVLQRALLSSPEPGTVPLAALRALQTTPASLERAGLVRGDAEVWRFVDETARAAVIATIDAPAAMHLQVAEAWATESPGSWQEVPHRRDAGDVDGALSCCRSLLQRDEEDHVLGVPRAILIEAVLGLVDQQERPDHDLAQRAWFWRVGVTRAELSQRDFFTEAWELAVERHWHDVACFAASARAAVERDLRWVDVAESLMGRLRGLHAGYARLAAARWARLVSVERALAHIEEAEAVARRHGWERLRLRASTNRAIVFVNAGGRLDPERCRQAAREAMAGGRAGVACSRWAMTAVEELNRGRLAPAESAARLALEMAKLTDLPVAGPLAQLAAIALDRGDIEGLRTLIDRVVRHARHEEHLAFVAFLELGYARRLGDVALITASLDRLEARERKLEWYELRQLDRMQGGLPASLAQRVQAMRDRLAPVELPVRSF